MIFGEEYKLGRSLNVVFSVNMCSLMKKQIFMIILPSGQDRYCKSRQQVSLNKLL